MAGMNWAYLAFGPDGKLERHATCDLAGFGVGIDKNHCQVWWDDAEGERRILTLKHGELEVWPLFVAVHEHDEQQARFMYAEDIGTPQGGERRFAGIGCYAFDDDNHQVDVQTDTVWAFWRWLEDEVCNEHDAEWLRACRESAREKPNGW
jgi:hypothetical protein